MSASADPIAPRRGFLAEIAARRRELTLFAASFVVLALFAGPRLLHQSQAPHFIYQADAWLHGQLQLRLPPPNLNDWARVDGRWYVSFPPGPALLMLPGVALFGLQFNDVLFTIGFAALNVLLFFLVLERFRTSQESTRSRADNLAIALLFAFGTLAFCCSIRGEVWFTAEVLGITATCLFLLAAHRAAHPLLAGLAWGFAAITRTPLTFAVVFFVAEVIADGGRIPSTVSRLGTWRDPTRWRKVARFALGSVPFLAFAAWANWVRFGSPIDFGHAHLWNNIANADIAQHGLFSFHYLGKQVRAAFTLLPGLRNGRLTYDPDGMSLLITTPLFALLALPRAKPRLHLSLWLTVAACAVPGFLYHGTGWVQFGYRFSLDYTPYLFLLLAVGAWPMNRWFYALGLFGVAVNIWGALVFVGG